MSVTSKISKNGTDIEIIINGRFDFSIHKEFRDIYKDRNPKIGYIVNLVNTEYMDSSALGMLLLLREHVEMDKNKLRIMNCPQSILSVLKLANLDRLIRID